MFPDAHRGGSRISKKGGGGHCEILKRGAFGHICANVFPLYEVLGSPKKRGF